MSSRGFGFLAFGLLLSCASSATEPRGGGQAPIAEWVEHHRAAERSVEPADSGGEGRSRVLRRAEPEESPCVVKRRRAQELRTRATACQVDSDCSHYPSTCAAIANNPAADELVEVENWINLNCQPEREPFCGPTKPVCDAGVCTVEKLPSKLDP